MLARVPLLVRLLWPYASLLVSAVLTRVLVVRSISTLSILSLASQSFQHVLQPMLLLVRTAGSILQASSGYGSGAALMSPPFATLRAGLEVVMHILPTRHQQLM